MPIGMTRQFCRAALAMALIIAIGLAASPGIERVSAAGAPAPCAAADLDAAVAHGGAGGKLLGNIRITSTPWSDYLLLGRPQIEVRDVADRLIIASGPPDAEAGPAVTLSAGVGAAVRFEWANMCAPQPSGPLTVVIVLPEGLGQIRAHPAGTQAEEGPLAGGPPCTGPGQPAILTVVTPFTEAPGTTFGPPGGVPRYVGARFLAYWRMHGGMAVNGLPLSVEFDQRLEDGKTYSVQYFERVRLEYHPENAAPYDVLLGQFGRQFHPSDPPATPRADAAYFPQTGHNVRAGFWAYWQRFGDTTQFGYPLSEEFTERLEDGNTYTVQYFERARLEYHPENAFPYDVLLGQFGRRVLAESGR